MHRETDNALCIIIITSSWIIYQYVINELSFQSEELARQKSLRAELIQLEDVLGQLKKEYEMLRIEFEQNLAANEQTGPINREMRHLITSLQNHNGQLKGEAHRYKRKYKDSASDILKVTCEHHNGDGYNPWRPPNTPTCLLSGAVPLKYTLFFKQFVYFIVVPRPPSLSCLVKVTYLTSFNCLCTCDAGVPERHSLATHPTTRFYRIFNVKKFS